MTVQIWFVGEGAVVAGRTVACETPIPLFGAVILSFICEFSKKKMAYRNAKSPELRFLAFSFGDPGW